MPYISEARRQELHPFAVPDLDLPGELNYVLSVIVNNYIEDHGLSYGTINEVIGVLECAKLELYRRIAAPYEDKKREENGEVYTV